MTELAGIAVGIPAHNEAGTIGHALDAVLLATAGELPAAVVVAVDASRDRTAAVVRTRARHVPANTVLDVVEVHARSAGVARQVACAAAAERLAAVVGAAAPSWIATTDADSVVPIGWLDVHRAWARRGADAVAGLVRVDLGAALAPAVRRTLEREHTAARLGHQHVYGANLGVAAEWWRRVGGFPPVEVGEDRAFVDRLRSEGARVVAAEDSVVVTSGRLVARAPRGFGAHLAQLTTRAAGFGSAVGG